MAVSDRSRRWPGTQTPAGPTSRYDVQLAVIPLVFLVAIIAGLIAEVPIRGSIFVASVVGALVVADGLFRNPPDVGDAD